MTQQNLQLRIIVIAIALGVALVAWTRLVAKSCLKNEIRTEFERKTVTYFDHRHRTVSLAELIAGFDPATGTISTGEMVALDATFLEPEILSGKYPEYHIRMKETEWKVNLRTHQITPANPPARFLLELVEEE